MITTDQTCRLEFWSKRVVDVHEAQTVEAGAVARYFQFLNQGKAPRHSSQILMQGQGAGSRDKKLATALDDLQANEIPAYFKLKSQP